MNIHFMFLGYVKGYQLTSIMQHLVAAWRKCTEKKLMKLQTFDILVAQLMCKRR